MKNLTIRNVPDATKEYICGYADKEGITVSEALAKIITLSKQYESWHETAELRRHEINDLHDKISNLNQQKTALEKALETEKDANKIYLENSKAFEQEKETQVEALQREVERLQLTGSQFVCELKAEIAHNARKVRKWVIKDGYVKGDNYPNELVNVAVERFIQSKYADLV